MSVAQLVDIHGIGNAKAVQLLSLTEITKRMMSSALAETDFICDEPEKTALERTALVEPDGTAHYDNGVTKNVSARRYFKEAIRGKETLSDPLESSVDQETRVVLGVPVWKDEEVIGILCGSYNVTSLSRMLFNDFFEDVGYTLITNGYGEIIAYDGDSTYLNE